MMNTKRQTVVRKLCAVALAAAMLTGTGFTPIGSYIGTGMTANAAEETTATVLDTDECGENAVYTLYSDGTLVISGTGDMYDFGYETVMHNNHSKVKNLIIEEGITSIGSYSFHYYSYLESVSLPSTITRIGDYAFHECYNLKNIELNDNLTTIGNYAFCSCLNLENITFGSHIVSIGDYAFDYCSALTDITLPDSVQKLGKYAFANCYQLNSITLSNQLKSIEDDTFSYCSGLTNITVPSSVTNIGKRSFADCNNLKNVTLPDSVTAVGQFAFYNCKALTEITIPDNVTKIENYTFYNCQNLTKADLPETLTSIGSSAFQYCESLNDVTIPDDVNHIGASAFYGCKSLSDITIPGSIAIIKDHTFYNCSSLNSAVVSSGVNEIESSAFYGCTSLTDLILSDTLTKIGSSAFENCPNLKSVTVPDSVTQIEDNALGWKDSDEKIENFTITGRAGSTAETYATDNGFALIISNALKNNSTINKTEIILGESVKLTGNAGGGTGGYTYAVFYKPKTSSSWTRVQDYESSITTAITPQRAISYDVRVKVKDSSNRIVNKDFTLKVNTELVNNSTIDKTTVNLGENIYLTGKASGGIGDYTYAVFYRPAGSSSWTTVQTYKLSTNVIITPKRAIDYDIRVKVKDSTGKTVNKDFTVKVNEKLVNTSTIDKTSITIGDSVTLTGKAKGGVGDYSYAVYYKQESQTPWTKVQGYAPSITETITPKVATTYHILVKVKDSNGNITDKEFTVNVNRILINNSTINKTSITLGDSVKLTGKASGGSGEYQYAVYYKQASKTGWSKVQDYAPTITETVTPQVATAYIVRVKVKDSVGKVTDKDFTVNVYKPLVNNSTISSTTITLHESVSLTGKASGGSGDYQYAVAYQPEGADKWTLVQGYDSSITATITPKKAITYTVRVKVKDSNNTVTEKYFTLKVNTELLNNSTIDKEEIVLGDSVTVTGSASGGSGEYQYAVAYQPEGADKWTLVQDYASSVTGTITPKKATAYTVRVRVKDSAKKITEKYFTVKVNAKLANTSTIDKTEIVKGDSVTVTGSAEGGIGEYQYAVYYRPSDKSTWTTVQDYASSITETVTPKNATDYVIRVKVQDSNGNIKTKDFTVKVNKKLANTSTIDKTEIVKGDSITVTGSATGGVGKYTYYVEYKQASQTNWTKVQDYKSSVTKSITPKNATDYVIRVIVKDSNGTAVEKEFTVNVTK